MRIIATVMALGSCCVVAACSSPGAYVGADGGGARHFSQLGADHKARSPASSPSIPPPAPAPVPTLASSPSPEAQVAAGASAADSGRDAPVLASSPDPRATSPEQARRRVDAWFTAQGFLPEDAGAGPTYRVTATRMAAADAGLNEAVCKLQMLDRPQMYATTVDVRLDPAPQGVQVGVQTHFEQMDQNLVSGALVKRACRSLGTLEAKVRKVAQGG